ncbi:MAG: hypothetical protein J0H78_19080 [Rhizobiales bacterium]|nr:hypothetical protein [Hyphomicrobiales bacterium]OJY44289.1 MAG: hypothetical protein BGP08_08810 [Rhizobiales bacterium 64-17]
MPSPRKDLKINHNEALRDLARKGARKRASDIAAQAEKIAEAQGYFDKAYALLANRMGEKDAKRYAQEHIRSGRTGGLLTKMLREGAINAAANGEEFSPAEIDKLLHTFRSVRVTEKYVAVSDPKLTEFLKRLQNKLEKEGVPAAELEAALTVELNKQFAKQDFEITIGVVPDVAGVQHVKLPKSVKRTVGRIKKELGLTRDRTIALANSEDD